MVTMPKMIAPKKAPMAEPYPPVSRQPPITAVMIASNSFMKPRRASVDPASITVMMATSAAAQAVSMKSDSFTLRTGTPEFCAALVSPPVAKIQFPAGVRSST